MRCWHAHVYPTPGIACWAAHRQKRAARPFARVNAAYACMPTSEYVCRRNPHGSLHGAAARERAKVRGEGRQCAARASAHSHGRGRCAQQQRCKGRAPHVSQGEWRGDAPRKLRLENFSVSHYCPVTGQHMDPDTMSSSPASPVPVLPPAAVQGSKLADFALRDYHQVAAVAPHGSASAAGRAPHGSASAGGAPGAYPALKKRAPARANSATACCWTPTGRAPPPPARRSV